MLSEGRERDSVGNVVPSEMIGAEQRLVGLSNITISEAEPWDW